MPKDDRELVARLNAKIHQQREAIRHLEFVVAEQKREIAQLKDTSRR